MEPQVEAGGLPLLLAPMAGVTDLPFRLLCRRFGATGGLTEMVSAKALTFGDQKSRKLCEIDPAERPCAIQLFGHEPEVLGQAARLVEAFAPDGIDLNMGCPMPKIVGSGDGAALMHTGAMAVIGSRSPNNLIHVIVNNEAHESVGGQPTVASAVSFVQIASACGYAHALGVENAEELRDLLSNLPERQGPIFLEVKAAVGSREDLGRPTTTPLQNKKVFMDFLKERD